MPPLSNQRWEAFARAISRGESGAAAYRGTYHTTGNAAEVNGSKLLRNAKVAERIAELKGRLCEKTLIDVEFLTNELLENARLARQARQFAAVTSSLALVAKLHGLIVDKQESVISHRPAPLPTKLLELSESEWVAQFSRASGPMPALTERAKKLTAERRKLNGHAHAKAPVISFDADEVERAPSRPGEIDLG
ncbi:Terminase small subunit [Rhizobium cauense]|uniref:terminase small subunit n=1 Tax=Rhizobium cauense TaxID=1166683 RepID=UPI001C6E1C0A|nr:terminase small subunit [Rhizobium cauense]MBW9116620.1 Terminase small subunit [Rhizobium cauense]